MALTVAWNGYGRVTDAEDASTGWSTTGNIASETDEADIYIQNTQAVSSKASSKAGALIYDIGSGNELNFSSVGSETDQHVFIWLNCTTVGTLATVDNGGLRVWLGTDTSNFREWYILGSDTLDRYSGGWIRVVIDPTKIPTAETGTFNEASVRYFGIYVSTLASAKAENLIIDAIDVGYGLRAYGTSSDGWQDIVDADMGTQVNKYGILQDKDGIFFAHGALEIGDDQSTNSTTMTDQDRVIRWVSQDYRNAALTAWLPSISDGLFSLKIVSNGTNGTGFQDGIKVGNSLGRNGSLFLGSDLHRTLVKLDDGNNSLNNVDLYGTTFKLMARGIDFGATTIYHSFYGGTVDQCGQFIPKGNEVRNVVISNTTAIAPIDAAVEYDSPTYNDHTSASRDESSTTTKLTPLVEVGGDIFYFGARKPFSAIGIWMHLTSSTAHTITWEYYNGSWTTLTVTDGSENYTRGGTVKVTFTAPGDWEMLYVNAQGPFYYVRARLTGATGTAATARIIWFEGPVEGSALLWDSSMDLEDCQFIAHSQALGVDPHAIEHPDEGEFDYTNLVFSGNDYDIENPTPASVSRNYDPTVDTDVDLDGDPLKVAQTFTPGATGDLSRARFKLKKTGSPTGNVTASLFATSTGAPTGDPLDTSRVVLASSIGTSYDWVDFEFDGQVEMTLGITYAIAVEYVGDGSNYISVGVDDSSPTHSGTGYQYNPTTQSWASNTWDVAFYAFRDGIVVVNNLGTSNASTYEQTSDYPKGTTIIQTSYTLTINVSDEDGVAIQNAQTAIYTNDANRTQLMNEDTDSLGVATEIYNGSVPQSVEVRVRRTSPGGFRYIPFSQIATITTAGLTLDVRLRVDPNAVPAEEEALMGGEPTTLGGERVIWRR